MDCPLPLAKAGVLPTTFGGIATLCLGILGASYDRMDVIDVENPVTRMPGGSVLKRLPEGGVGFASLECGIGSEV